MTSTRAGRIEMLITGWATLIYKHVANIDGWELKLVTAVGASCFTVYLVLCFIPHRVDRGRAGD